MNIRKRDYIIIFIITLVPFVLYMFEPDIKDISVALIASALNSAFWGTLTNLAFKRKTLSK